MTPTSTLAPAPSGLRLVSLTTLTRNKEAPHSFSRRRNAESAYFRRDDPWSQRQAGRRKVVGGLHFRPTRVVRATVWRVADWPRTRRQKSPTANETISWPLQEVTRAYDRQNRWTAKLAALLCYHHDECFQGRR